MLLLLNQYRNGESTYTKVLNITLLFEKHTYVFHMCVSHIIMHFIYREEENVFCILKIKTNLTSMAF